MLALAEAREPACAPTHVTRLIDRLSEAGVDREELCRALGTRPDSLDRLPPRLSPRVMNELWAAVVRVTGERGFGLRVAAATVPEHHALFGSVLSRTATLGDALVHAVRLFPLLSATVHLSLQVDAHRVRLVLEPRESEGLHPERSELFIGSMVGLARRLTETAVHPSMEVFFTHPAEEGAPWGPDFFEAPVHYGAAYNGLHLDSARLTEPVKTADPERLLELQASAERVLARTHASGGYRRRVLDAIGTALGQGDARIEIVSARLGLHPKGLSRRLRAEGTSYRLLLAEVRERLAEQYLARSNHSVAEVASLLGYSQKSSFNRAFRRWTGQAPHRYKHKGRGEVERPS